MGLLTISEEKKQTFVDMHSNNWRLEGCVSEVPGLVKSVEQVGFKGVKWGGC